MNQLTQQKMLIEKLSSDQEKVSAHELTPLGFQYFEMILCFYFHLCPLPQNMHLINDMQTAFLQLQAECEKLGDCNRNLLEENQEKESRVQVECGQTIVSTFSCCSFL